MRRPREETLVDTELIRNWVAVIALVISASSVIVVWLKAPGQSIARKLGEIREDLKKHDRRIQRVEQEIKHLPTSEEVAELQIGVTRLEGDMKRIEETLGGVKSTVQSIDNYLRQNR